MAVNILVADDSVTMRRILELTFQGEDARVTAVESGESAVRKASELTPDIVFADLSVSSGGMDGYAIASAIKAAPGLERTAVVVMASQKHPYDDEKGKAAGVDDHILKPFDTQHVIDRVKQVLSRPRVAPAGVGRVAAPAVAPAAPANAATAAGASRIGTKTIAFGKPPAAANAANAGNAPAAPGGAPPRPQVAAGAPGFAASAAAKAGVGVATAHQAHQQAHQAAPVVQQHVAAPVAAPVPAPVAAAVAAASGNLEHKLSGLGLTAEQVEAVTRLSREVVERVVWEVVPDMAEALIKEEIRRLTAS